MPLSAKQTEYLAIAWECFESEPKVDYERFYKLAGLASAHSARELLRVTKKKLREEYGSGAAAAAGEATAAKAATGKSAGRAAKKARTTAPVKAGKGKRARAEFEDEKDDELADRDDGNEPKYTPPSSPSSGDEMAATAGRGRNTPPKPSASAFAEDVGAGDRPRHAPGDATLPWMGVAGVERDQERDDQAWIEEYTNTYLT